jgi:DNA end-binding protein Ku
MAKEKPQKKYHGARAFWSGTISFGLVSIPVNLFPANRSRSTGLRLLDKDGTPLRRRFFCPKDERDVHPEHVLRGYELENGEYVVVTDEELESLEPRKTRDIDLTRFVNKDDVPATLFERGYYLTPAGDSTKAYRLLAEVMEETGRVGIATFVMRGKEYLVAILAEDGIMRAETLRFQNEVRTPEDVGLPEKSRVSSQAVSKFAQAIKKLSKRELADNELKDDYAERLQRLAEKKLKSGEDVVEAKVSKASDEDVDEEDDEVDLLETIRRSLHARNGNGRSRPKAKSRRKRA